MNYVKDHEQTKIFFELSGIEADLIIRDIENAVIDDLISPNLYKFYEMLRSAQGIHSPL